MAGDFKQFYFRRQVVTTNLEIINTDDVVQVGFLNYGETNVRINGHFMPPVPDPVKYQFAQYIWWLPIGTGERDSSRYRIQFEKNDNRLLKRELIVFFKVYSRPTPNKLKV